MQPGPLIAAIDQGTTSSRCALVDRDGHIVASHQLEHRQLTPRPGWLEHDPVEILDRVVDCLAGACRQIGFDAAVGGPTPIAAIGISNQRETTVVWDRRTGAPVTNAIVWQDARTASAVQSLGAALDPATGRAWGIDRFRGRTGLPLSTYSSALKLRAVLDQLPAARRAAARDGELLFGTIDTWLIWNLTGGADAGAGAVHATDATNASRTMLMDLDRLAWDASILDELAIPRAMLPRITGSSRDLGECRGPAARRAGIEGVPITGVLGDQHAALLGHGATRPGEAKCTYGTGAFMLRHTGDRPIPSTHGLITTVAAWLGDDARDADGRPLHAATYALEGSVAVAGSLIQWLRDQLGIIGSAAEVEALARSVPDAGDVVVVPAFNGLFAPYWRSDARGIIAGLTRFATRAHIARAALEAVACQVADLDAAMRADVRDDASNEALRVDGGMVANDLLMQLQADLLGRPVVASATDEASALGAAFAAGLALGLWRDLDEIRSMATTGRRWEPTMAAGHAQAILDRWHKGVERSLGWIEGG